MNLTNIHPGARLGANVQVGAFTSIAENVEVGEGTVIYPNVTILDYVKIGKNCRIFSGAVIGAEPQDMKFRGEVSWVEIGDNCQIRECATVNRGTAASGKLKTTVGDNGLAGETDIDEFAILGGKTGSHQFTRIGAHSMTMGGSLVGKDVPPYIIVGHYPLSFGGVNRIGLRRRGFSNETIEEIHKIYRVIYQSGLNVTDSCSKVEDEFAPSVERDIILNFIRASKRGIVRGVDLSEE